MPRSKTIPPTSRQGLIAVRFIAAAAGVYATALSLAYLLIHVLPPPTRSAGVAMPGAFWITTPLLLAGSLSLGRACGQVRRERQMSFRRALLAALVLGVLFVALQAYGLWCLAFNQDPGEVQTGANAFVTVLAVLHVLHFGLAMLFLVWVTVNALSGRYDHEYYWGVTVCSWFWHALGLVWGVILVAILIVSRTGGNA